MRTITLRGIDEDLELRLRAKSKELGTPSLNGTVLHILRQALGLEEPRPRVVHHDLDHLAGTWSEDDLREFEDATAVLRRVDEGFWQ